VTFAGTDFKGAARPAGRERDTDPHPIRGAAAAPARDPAIAFRLHQRARIAAHRSRLRQACAPRPAPAWSLRRIS
jgi:hypothetical protein